MGKADASNRLSEGFPVGRDAVLSRFSVSRETTAKLDLLVSEVSRWQQAKNLVSERTLPEIWERHIADSLQLARHVPSASGAWVDLGSGAGFPGLIVAVQRTEAGLGPTILVESNHRKCAFLRHVGRLAQLDLIVRPERLESVLPQLLGPTSKQPVAAVSARALAPLAQLVSWSFPLLTAGAIGIFPKGQDVEVEISEAATYWDMELTLAPSLTDPAARIVIVRSARKKEP